MTESEQQDMELLIERNTILQQQYKDVNEFKIKLLEENAQLKELLYENKQKMFEAEKNYGFDDSIIDILTPQMDKIDKLLGDKTDD